MKAIRYGLWAATLIVVAWLVALVSVVVAGKGIDKIRVTVDEPGRDLLHPSVAEVLT